MSPHHPTPNHRHGLAPLELVLALPFLLGIMALIVNIGNVACWKVRALTVARHSLWSGLSPSLLDHKTGGSDPRSDYWPTDNTNAGTANVGNAANNVDNTLVNHPVVRGPSFLGVSVNSELLNPSRAIRTGTADITHVYPMLKSFGNFHLNAENYALDDAWRCTEMGITNNHLRLALIYPAFKPPTGSNAVLLAMLDIFAAVQSGQLDLLYGKESDYIKYQSLYGQTPPLFINSVPGWTPLKFRCNLDPTVVQTSVDDLIERIQGTKKDIGPLRDLSRDLQNYYRGVQEKIKALMQADPPPPAAQLAQMQKDLDTLDGYIQLLDQFISTL